MTIEDQPLTVIDITRLIGSVEDLHSEGFRLVLITCTKTGDRYEITYSFDRDLHFRSIRITAGEEDEIPSISGIYGGAFVYENEMHDLFGIRVRGMNIDYKGALIRTSVPFPFGQSPGGFSGGDTCQKP